MKIAKHQLQSLVQEELKNLSEKDWIGDVDKEIEKKGTEGVCTGDKFGGPTCRAGTKRYNLAKTFRKMADDRKDESMLTKETLQEYIEEVLGLSEDPTQAELPLQENKKRKIKIRRKKK